MRPWDAVAAGHFAVALLLPKQKIVLGQVGAPGRQQGRDIKRQRRFPDVPLKHCPSTGPSSRDLDIAELVKLKRNKIVGERYALKCPVAITGAVSQKLNCCSQKKLSDIFNKV